MVSLGSFLSDDQFSGADTFLVTEGEGVKKSSFLRDVNYLRPLSVLEGIFSHYFDKYK